MKQSKLESVIEALINTAVGFAITMFFLPFVNALCGILMSAGQMSISTILFTVLSILRGYIIRRFFCGNIAQFILTKIKIRKHENN